VNTYHSTLRDKVGMKLPNGERAIVPIEKLRDYCLHPTHRVGSHKAHVFESVLGLTAAHAEALQQWLLAAARTGEAVLGMQNAYGQRYIVDFEMTTTMGTAVVRSTWIILVGEDVPRLTSCYVL
jgi:hypothetical protein